MPGTDLGVYETSGNKIKKALPTELTFLLNKLYSILEDRKNGAE